MIRPLRTIHRHLFYVLAVFLPVLALTALVVRRPEPMTIVAAPISVRSSKGFIDLRFLQGSIALTSNQRPSPEIIVYWSSQAAAKPDASARLLGRISRMPLVFKPDSERGTLLFYCPATDTVIDTASVGGKP